MGTEYDSDASSTMTVCMQELEDALKLSSTQEAAKPASLDGAQGANNKPDIVRPNKEELEELIKTPGPNGISFAKAVQRRKNAIKTAERFLNMETLTVGAAEILNKAKRIVEDKELEAYVDQQIYYRNLMGIKPKIHSADNSTGSNRKEKEVRMETSSFKRKLSDDPVERRAEKMAKPATTKEYSKASTSKEARKELEALRMALIDISSDDGKIKEDVRNDVEVKVLMKLISKRDSSIFFEAGWYKGHRCYTCSNQASADFLKEAVTELKVKDGNIKAIPMEEINSYRQPRGWIWIPKPYLKPEMVLELLKVQNPDYETLKWSIVSVGKQKTFGQHFLVKITKEDVPKLKSKKMELKVGMATSVVIIDGKEPGKEVEPVSEIVEC